ncbi:MAG: hypothetical protein WDA16_05745 [Candidatus Thermoplasmatota archaeon]
MSFGQKFISSAHPSYARMLEAYPSYGDDARQGAPVSGAKLPSKPSERTPPGGGGRETGVGHVDQNAGRDATAGE